MSGWTDYGVDTARICGSTFPSIDRNFFCESNSKLSTFKGSLFELVHFKCGILGHPIFRQNQLSIRQLVWGRIYQKKCCLPCFCSLYHSNIHWNCLHHLIPVNVPFNVLKSFKQCSKSSAIALFWFRKKIPVHYENPHYISWYYSL